MKMPNWCACTLTLTGSNDALQQFKSSMEKINEHGKYVPFSLNQTLPRPASHPDLIEWSVENWGTKWDVDNPEVITTPSSIQIFFNTAWSPPIEWLQNVISKFPGLNATLAFCEIGAGYYGQTTIIEGNETCEQYKITTNDTENIEDEDGDIIDIKPIGKLLAFMQKHEMPEVNLGG